ncbi:hypothetical protein Mal15_55150 [Stieleria maiorica]|uniref:Uncharacterized protein n=1 Tax=Stieleria maiorica TaxID=2795974 RepID=A0A5B9MJQ0_9BACT|nr:hypothetical protein [Stieleria maiorica]QEG01439.1 hypothetical protein Mal15_55150 [Stieleria maiorica]
MPSENNNDNSNSFLRVRSPKLGVMPGEEEELVNEGMYGKAFALYLRDALGRKGCQATQVVCEDWGWWVTVSGLPFSCGIGIYGMRIDHSDDLDLCVTVLTPRGKKWSWSRFRFVDTTADVDRLHEAIREICAADDDVTIVAETPGFPL